MTIKDLPADYLLTAQQGGIDKARTCLALGVNINTCDRQGKTVITLASLYQQYACVQTLIDAGADINKQNLTCLNPFSMGCLSGDLTLLRIILSAKPDLNRVTRFGDVDLMPAYEKGHLSIVKELLTHTEINVDQANHVGWTPLLEATVFSDDGIKQQAVVQLLLGHGASPHLTDRYGKTSLELARGRSFEEIARLLIVTDAQTGGFVINAPERQYVWALTADADFPAQWGQGQVEQVLARTISTVLPIRQQLLVPSYEEYDNAPSNCRLALIHSSGLFRHGDKVQFDEQGITVGRYLHIEVSRRRRWLFSTLQMTAANFHLTTWQQWRDIIHQRLGEDETLLNYCDDSPLYQASNEELHIK